MIEEEKWRAVPEWPEYHASNLGRVKRVKAATGTRPGKILKPSNSKDGYLRVSLSRPGNRQCMTLHKLIAVTFLGINARNDVCHFDGNRKNCRLSNLRYDTRKGNMQDAIRHGTTPKGERCGTNKWPEVMVRKVKNDLSCGNGLTATARKYGMPLSTVQGIKEGRIWAWL